MTVAEIVLSVLLAIGTVLFGIIMRTQGARLDRIEDRCHMEHGTVAGLQSDVRHLCEGVDYLTERIDELMAGLMHNGILTFQAKGKGQKGCKAP